jgi:hypothetical protein
MDQSTVWIKHYTYQKLQDHIDELLFSNFLLLQDLRSSRLKALTFSYYGLLLLMAISPLANNVSWVDVCGLNPERFDWKGWSPPWVWWNHSGWKAARMGRIRVNHLLTVPCQLSQRVVTSFMWFSPVATEENHIKLVLGRANLPGKWATDVRYGGKDMIEQSNHW